MLELSIFVWIHVSPRPPGRDVQLFPRHAGQQQQWGDGGWASGESGVQSEAGQSRGGDLWVSKEHCGPTEDRAGLWSWWDRVQRKTLHYHTLHHVTILSFFFPEGNLWQVASKLNTLLTSENERLQQLTEDLKQKHSHMTSEVGLTYPHSLMQYVQSQVQPTFMVTIKHGSLV